jgi:hypothetical protein
LKCKEQYVSVASNLKEMKAEQETHFPGFISPKRKIPLLLLSLEDLSAPAHTWLKSFKTLTPAQKFNYANGEMVFREKINLQPANAEKSNYSARSRPPSREWRQKFIYSRPRAARQYSARGDEHQRI